MKKIKYLFFILIFFISITNVKAEETKTGIGYLNNSSVIISDNRGNDIQLSRLTTNSQNITIRNIIFQSNYNFQKDIVYEYEIELANQYIDNISSIYLRGGDTICSFISLQGLNDSYLKIRFTCPSNVSYITIGLSNLGGSAITDSYNIQWKNIYLWQINDAIDLGPIINGQNQNTQDIINNDDKNTQDIINNQNELLGTKCDNLFNYNLSPNDISLGNFTYTLSNGIFTFNGTDSNYKYIGYNIRLTKGTYYWGGVQNGTGSNGISSMITYNNNNIKLFCDNSNCSFKLDEDTNIIFYPFRLGGSSFTANNFIVKPFISKTNNSYCEYGSYISKLDEQNETSKGILSKLKDLFDTLFSNEDADVSGLDNMVGWLPPGPVDSIINLPLALFNALTNTLSGTCQDVTLTLPFVNQTLTLPCFDRYMQQYLSNFSTFWTLVGFIVSVFILYNYLLALYKWVDDTLTFRENNMPGYYGDNWGGGA